LHDLASREKTLARANKPKRLEVPIEIGDLVLIKSLGYRAKLEDRLKGPFRVLQKLGSLTLEEINAKSGKPRVFQFHRTSVQHVPDFVARSAPEKEITPPESRTQPAVSTAEENSPQRAAHNSAH
jgi:hypothetical protein